MINMPTCSYCKKNYKEPRGLTVFTFDGRTVHFCSSKCRKNLSLGREARKLNWVKRRAGFSSGESLDLEPKEEERKRDTEDSGGEK